MGPWSSEQCQLIEEAVVERLDGWLEPGEHLVVTGRSAGELTEVTFTLEGRSAGDRLVLESRVDQNKARVPEEAARDLAIDALDLVLLDYLESQRERRFSGVWEERELRGKPVRVRVERTFPSLDAQADALLAAAGLPAGDDDAH